MEWFTKQNEICDKLEKLQSYDKATGMAQNGNVVPAIVLLLLNNRFFNILISFDLDELTLHILHFVFYVNIELRQMNNKNNNVHGHLRPYQAKRHS